MDNKNEELLIEAPKRKVGRPRIHEKKEKKKIGRPPKTQEEKYERYNAYQKKYQLTRYKNDEEYRNNRKQICANYRASVKDKIN